MNNMSEQQKFNNSDVLSEFSTPFNVSAMPTIFRLTSFHFAQLNEKVTQCTATLYHEKAALKVRWTLNRPDLRLKSGDLVSPRWLPPLREGESVPQLSVIELGTDGQVSG